MPRAVDLDARKVSTSVLGRKKIEENKENAVSIEKLANLEIQDEKQSESSHVEKRKTQLLGHALDNPDLSGLVKRAERLERDRQYGKALKLYRRLLEQHVDVREKVKSVEAQAKVVKANGGWYPNEQTSHHELPGGYILPSTLYSQLFPHQRDGVKWMWKLYGNENMGGILGDDMGMGKTIQVISYLYGLFVSGKARHVLIAMPLGLLETWKVEFRKWFPQMRVNVFHGPATAIKKDLQVVLEKGGVILTTYDKVRLNTDKLMGGEDHVWDYIILDEGHYIKNQSSQKAKAVRQIRAKHKLLLSGTPIQNNMEELWSLFDYVCNGNLLSTKRNFMTNFGNHIKKGEARDATPEEKQIGNKIAEALRELIAPYFIRREKSSLLTSNNEKEGDAVGQDTTAVDSKPLGAKKELAVWVAMSDAQVRLYEAFLTNLNLHEILISSKSPLTSLGVLKKICDHPALVSHSLKDCETLDLESIAASADDYRSLMAQSAKLEVTVELLETLRNNGHRTLLVASSTKMLDLIQKCIEKRDIQFTRIDGAISDRKERQRRINMFNRGTSCDVFLLSTQVAIGITLTGADRVIMYDPSWNPKRDAQAVDRAYRVGQDKDVVVYRLVTCGTMEEKIYRNQVRKEYLAKSAMEKGSHARYFTQSELKDMFKLDDPSFSHTQRYLSSRHPVAKGSDERFQMQVAEVESLGAVRGVNRHDQLYTLSEDVTNESEEGDAMRMVEEALKKFTIEDNINNYAKTPAKVQATPARTGRKRSKEIDLESAMKRDMASAARTKERRKKRDADFIRARDNDSTAVPNKKPILLYDSINAKANPSAAPDFPSPIAPRGWRRVVIFDDDEEATEAKDGPQLNLTGSPNSTSNGNKASFIDLTNSPINQNAESLQGNGLDAPESPSPIVRRIRKRNIITDDDLEDDAENKIGELGNAMNDLHMSNVDESSSLPHNNTAAAEESRSDAGNEIVSQKGAIAHENSIGQEMPGASTDFLPAIGNIPVAHGQEISNGHNYSASEADCTDAWSYGIDAQSQIIDRDTEVEQIVEHPPQCSIESPDMQPGDFLPYTNKIDDYYNPRDEQQALCEEDAVLSSEETSANKMVDRDGDKTKMYEDEDEGRDMSNEYRDSRFVDDMAEELGCDSEGEDYSLDRTFSSRGSQGVEADQDEPGMPSVCPEGIHVSSVFSIHNCRCIRSDNDMDAYDELLFTYSRQMRKKQYSKALATIKEAVEICDDDARCLHAMLILGRVVVGWR